MDIDLPAILLWVVLVLGVIWLIDKVVFEKSRLAQNADAEDPKLVEYSKAFSRFYFWFWSSGVLLASLTKSHLSPWSRR